MPSKQAFKPQKSWATADKTEVVLGLNQISLSFYNFTQLKYFDYHGRALSVAKNFK